MAPTTLLVWVLLSTLVKSMPYCGNRPSCDEWCPLGYDTDEHGCTICSCLQHSRVAEDDKVQCEPPVCLFYQAACVEYDKDEDGCDTCHCKIPFNVNSHHQETTASTAGGTLCQLKPCPFYLPVCAVYKKDEKGCNRCDCEVAIGDIVSLGKLHSNLAMKDYKE